MSTLEARIAKLETRQGTTAERTAFQLDDATLLASGHVRCTDDIYWLTDPGKQSTAAMLNRKHNDSSAEI